MRNQKSIIRPQNPCPGSASPGRFKMLLYSIPVWVLVLLLISCGTSMEKLRPWLNNMKGETTINVEGKWESPEWGTAYFIQKDGNLTGTIGSYEIIGSINGDTVYLVIGSSGTFYNSAILKYYKNSLIGKYTYNKLKDDNLPRKSYAMTLIREGE